MPNTPMVEERLRFLNIDATTSADIRAVRKIIAPSIDGLLDRFYEHILAQPQLRALFSDPGTIERARAGQRQHWLDSLFNGKYDNDYFIRTEQIGRAHARVGLTPNWYIGGYCYMFGQLVELIAKEFSNDRESMHKYLLAVTKAIHLDIDLVMHCYLEAKDESMRQILRRATNFCEDATVLSANLSETASQISDSISVSSHADAPSPQVAGDAGAVERLTQLVERLTQQTTELRDRLGELQYGDRLFFADDTATTGTFARLKALVFGKD